MELNPTTVTTTPAKAAAPAAASDTSEAKNALAGDFETFLKLLTTQLQNQDPLKPMESTEFVAQLASFSAVEQQIRSNDRLDRIVEVLSGGSSDGLAAWIGKEVRAPVKGQFDGEALDIAVTPKTDADRAVLVVRNDFDQVVARRTIDPAAESVVWDGENEAGTLQPNGRYGFAVESYQGEDLLGTAPGKVFATVNEVRFVDGSPVLVVEGGAQVALADVSGLR